MKTEKKSKKGGGQTVVWWVLWITLTIAAFFVAAAIWSPWIAAHFGSVRNTRAAVIWVTAVFGTWLVILIPLIVVMYQKVDKAYDDARMRREKAALQFRSASVPSDKRRLPAALSEILRQKPETISGGHLVDLTLKGGRQIPHVFVVNANEILGIYNAHEMDFNGQDVESLAVNDMAAPPVFHTTNWLRLDGVTASQ